MKKRIVIGLAACLQGCLQLAGNLARDANNDIAITTINHNFFMTAFLF
jgi:hypothetical protein